MNKYHLGDLVGVKVNGTKKVVCGKIVGVLKVIEANKKEIIDTYMYAIDAFDIGLQDVYETDIIGVVK